MATVARKFDKRILKLWSTPKTVVCANAFVSAELNEICDVNNIILDNAFPYQNTNGLAERRNRIVEQILRA